MGNYIVSFKEETNQYTKIEVIPQVNPHAKLPFYEINIINLLTCELNMSTKIGLSISFINNFQRY